MGRRENLRVACEITHCNIPVAVEQEDGSEITQIMAWPVLLPHNLVAALVDQGRLNLLLGDAPVRHLYWQKMKMDFTSLSDVDPNLSAPLALYGDAQLFAKPQWLSTEPTLK